MNSGLADIPTSQYSWASSVPNHQVTSGVFKRWVFLVLKKVPTFFVVGCRWSTTLGLDHGTCPGGDVPWFMVQNTEGPAARAEKCT